MCYNILLHQYKLYHSQKQQMQKNNVYQLEHEHSNFC